MAMMHPTTIPAIVPPGNDVADGFRGPVEVELSLSA